MTLARPTRTCFGPIDGPCDEWYVVVVNIRDYLREARDDPAATYFASLREDVPLKTATELKGVSGDGTLIKTTDAVAAIVTRLQEHSEIPANVVEALLRLGGPELLVTGRERELLTTAICLLGDDAWESILSTGLSLPAAAAMQRVWQLRANAVERFREHLNADDWAEDDWQTFFETETWIFGLALDCQFLHLVEGQPLAMD